MMANARSTLKPLEWQSYRSKLLSSPEVSKQELILAWCTGRRVLDLGCIDHSADTAVELGDDWLHAGIAGVATETVGVDMLADAARVLNDRGFDIRVGDVEALDLGETFDVVVAGDLIEHVSNIGNFLTAASRHMNGDSIFVVTTPNPFNMEQVMNGIFRNKTFVNAEHTVCIDPKAMYQLVERSPLAIVDFSWVDTRYHFKLEKVPARHVVNPLTNWVMKHRPLVRRDYAVVLKLR